MRLKLLLVLILVLNDLLSYSQQKNFSAVRISKAPVVDGNLDDSCWINLLPAKDFIQNFPDYGKPSSVRTEVKIAYDDDAIYIGAYLYDDPALIRQQLTARDAERQKDVDHFSVFFDTYQDRQNGFQFTVTSVNVQSDARLGQSLDLEFGEYGDKTWDAVWASKVGIKKDGWVVEMRIPYISLRFAKKDVQNWGMQLMRFTRRNNETAFWNEVNPNVTGFVNQFGHLQNLENIKPPLRLSFSPYVTGGYRNSPEIDGDKTTWLRNGGMDVKYGINESFTLDATLIPDFGQVISDNVVNNLTPYEVRFQENRPFFTEGTELFNKAGLFYSRRVGAEPAGYYDVEALAAANPNLDIVKNPSVTQLYNAIKFSGRTKNKLGIGFFNAVTAPMRATVKNVNTGEEDKIETAPLANYNILVLDQALRGRSYITFTNTSVIRDAEERDANVSALDIALYDKQNIFGVTAKGRYSKIYGSESYDGFSTELNAGKVSGKWQYSLKNLIESERYDPTDLGYLDAPNEVSSSATISYNQFTPTKNFLTYSYKLTTSTQYLYKPYAFNRFDVSGEAMWVFKNFWDLSLLAYITPLKEHDYFELRTPGRYLELPLNYIAQISGSTDSRKRAFISYSGTWAHAPDFHNKYYNASLGIRYRFSNRFTLSLDGNRESEENQLGYAFLRESNNEPIVAFRDNIAVTSVLSGIYNFTSRINLTLRARHYWNKVLYKEFFTVNDKGGLVSRPFIPNRDENFNIFNIDAFFTWDFRLGSRLILGWKNWLGDYEYVDRMYSSYYNNVKQIFDLRHGNEASLKFIYFLDYNQLRKKKR